MVEPLDRVLAGGIDGGVGGTGVTVGRRNIDDGAAALSAHHPQLVLHAEERAEHIGIECRGVAVGGLLRHRAGLAFGPGAVDGRIQATEAREGLIGAAAYIVLAAHVGADELRFAAELAQLSGQRLADVLMTAGNNDRVAFPRKGEGRGTPNPLLARR